MNKKISVWTAVALSVLLPASAFAVSNAYTNYLDCPQTNGPSLCTIMDQIITYFDWTLILLMGFAVLMFTWYVIKYYVLPNEDRKAAGQYVMYSVIGFFVVLSLWGIVNILSNTFGGLSNSENDYIQENIPLMPTN